MAVTVPVIVFSKHTSEPQPLYSRVYSTSWQVVRLTVHKLTVRGTAPKFRFCLTIRIYLIWSQYHTNEHHFKKGVGTLLRSEKLTFYAFIVGWPTATVSPQQSIRVHPPLPAIQVHRIGIQKGPPQQRNK